MTSSNAENFENYKKKFLSSNTSRGKLIPSNDKLSLEQLVKQLVAEGFELLKQEEKSIKSSPATKPVQKKSSVKNPYQLAREQVLAKMKDFNRNEILEMEKTNNTNNRFYEEFVKEVNALGDTLSK